MKVDSTVHDILIHNECREVCTITSKDSVFNALKAMALRNLSALLVLEADEVVGLITEQDYARKVILHNRSSRTTKVEEIMERSVLYVTPNDNAEGCLALMTNNRVKHLAVLDDEQLLGLISMEDVVKAMIHDREFLIDQLTHYITGSYIGWFDNHDPSSDQIERRIIGHVSVQH